MLYAGLLFCSSILSISMADEGYSADLEVVVLAETEVASIDIEVVQLQSDQNNFGGEPFAQLYPKIIRPTLWITGGMAVGAGVGLGVTKLQCMNSTDAWCELGGVFLLSPALATAGGALAYASYVDWLHKHEDTSLSKTPHYIRRKGRVTAWALGGMAVCAMPGFWLSEPGMMITLGAVGGITGAILGNRRENAILIKEDLESYSQK